MLFLLLHLVLLVLQWWQVIVTVIAVLITTDLVYKTCFQLFCLPKKTPNISWYFYITLILTVLTSTVGESTVLTSFSLGESQISNSSSRFFFPRQVRSGFWSLISTLDALDDVTPPLGPHFLVHRRLSWKIWEKHGKTMEKYGKIWEKYGKTWKSMGHSLWHSPLKCLFYGFEREHWPMNGGLFTRKSRV